MFVSAVLMKIQTSLWILKILMIKTANHKNKTFVQSFLNGKKNVKILG